LKIVNKPKKISPVHGTFLKNDSIFLKEKQFEKHFLWDAGPHLKTDKVDEGYFFPR